MSSSKKHKDAPRMAHHYLGNRMTAKSARMEKLGFELEDKGSMIPLWVVVDDCGGERPASLAEIVLWTSLTAPPAPVVPAGKALVPLVMTQAMREVTDSDEWDWPDLLAAAESITEEQHAELSAAAPIAPELDVTKILLNVVPGYEGEGLEIYAKSVDDVVALLTKQGERIEDLESRVAAPAASADDEIAALRAETDRLRECVKSVWRKAESAAFERGFALREVNVGGNVERYELTPVAPASRGWPDFVRRTNEEYTAWCKITYTPDSLDNRGMPTDGGLYGLWAWQEQERRKMAAPVAPADHSLTEAVEIIESLMHFESKSDEWKSARAFLDGLDCDQATASVGDKPETSEPVAWLSPHGIPHDQYVPGDMPLYTAQTDVPPGWVLVPVEPTQTMIDEVEQAARLGAFWTAGSAYKAMLAATPKAPT